MRRGVVLTSQTTARPHPLLALTLADITFELVDTTSSLDAALGGLGVDDVVVIDADEFDAPVSSIADLLHNRVPGSVVVTSSEAPSDPKIFSMVTVLRAHYARKRPPTESARWGREISQLADDPSPERGIRIAVFSVAPTVRQVARDRLQREPVLFLGADEIVNGALEDLARRIAGGEIDTASVNPVDLAVRHVDTAINSEAEAASRDVFRGGGGGGENVPLHWNSRFPDHPDVNASHVLIVGTGYAFRTLLEAEADPAAAQATVVTPVPDGELVAFQIESKELWLRVKDAGGLPSDAVGSSLVPFRAGSGTPPFNVEIHVPDPGLATLDLKLIVRGAPVAWQQLQFMALLPDEAHPGGTPPASPDSSRLTVGNGALGDYPEAAARLALFERDGRLRLRASPRGGFDQDGFPAALAKQDISSRIRECRRILQRASDNYQHGADAEALSMAFGSDAMLTFAQVGASLHEALFGFPGDDRPETYFRRLQARSIAQLGSDDRKPSRLHIEVSELPIPWGLLYDAAFREEPDQSAADPRCPEDVDVTAFWGYRFRLDRSVMGSNHLGDAAGLGTTATSIRPCINPHLDKQGVPVVAAQRGVFSKLANRPGISVLGTIESVEQLNQWLSDVNPRNGCDLLYFFCHAVPAVDVHDSGIPEITEVNQQAKLILDSASASGGVSVKTLVKSRQAQLHNRPLVLMNACATGQGTDWGFGPFVSLFLNRWQARGFVGTEWKIPSAFADPFGRRVLTRFVEDGDHIGTVLHRATRDALDLGNPFSLIYCLFGRPDLEVPSGGT